MPADDLNAFDLPSDSERLRLELDILASELGAESPLGAESSEPPDAALPPEPARATAPHSRRAPERSVTKK